MKEKAQDTSSVCTGKDTSPGIRTTSGLQAGFTCPDGWWKKKEGKTNLCCHWVYDPIWRQYIAECNA